MDCLVCDVTGIRTYILLRVTAHLRARAIHHISSSEYLEGQWTPGGHKQAAFSTPTCPCCDSPHPAAARMSNRVPGAQEAGTGQAMSLPNESVLFGTVERSAHAWLAMGT